MPINNDLPNKKFPMKFKMGEKPCCHFTNAIMAINVELVDCPLPEQLLSYIPRFALATWEDIPRNDYTNVQRHKALKDLFKMKLLPTAMETIGLTFLISNIDLIDVTHLIRHRSMSFSAHCTGDRDQRHDTCLVKPSIASSPKFKQRYINVVNQCLELYADMVDSCEVSILDARTILPRSFANHYYARVNLKDFIAYLRQRLDRQIQPESDNIIALRMLVEFAKIYPEISYCIDLDAPDAWYVKTAQEDHSSNLFMPEDRNDVFEYKEQWFVYPKKRSEMPGGQVFIDEWNKLVEEYENAIKQMV